MKAMKWIMAAGVAAGMAAGPVWARVTWNGEGGWGPGSSYARLYDPQHTETQQGDVQSVRTVTPMRGMRQGVEVILKTGAGDLPVHLGPAWYIENQDVKIAPGDRISVSGSRVQLDGRTVLLAAEVVKGNQTLRLRDAGGMPVWSGWRRR